MKRILMRGDDLGYSRAVNYGIADSVHAGMIRNVGVMVNKQWAKHGLKLLRNTSVCLGLHTNISSGKPLCNPVEIPSLVREDGMFHHSKDYNQATEDIVELDEVICEIEAQLQQFISLVGRKPDYFEGHAVASLNFFKGMEEVAKRHDLLYSPFPVSIEEPVMIQNQKVYMHSGSEEHLTPFQTLKHIADCAREDAVEMIVYHPGYVDADIMRASSLNMPRIYETEMLCDAKSAQYLEQKDIRLISYLDL